MITLVQTGYVLLKLQNPNLTGNVPSLRLQQIQLTCWPTKHNDKINNIFTTKFHVSKKRKEKENAKITIKNTSKTISVPDLVKHI